MKLFGTKKVKVYTTYFESLAIFDHLCVERDMYENYVTSAWSKEEGYYHIYSVKWNMLSKFVKAVEKYNNLARLDHVKERINRIEMKILG